MQMIALTTFHCFTNSSFQTFHRIKWTSFQEFVELLHVFVKNPSAESVFTAEEESVVFIELIKKYVKFYEATRSGKYRAKAQFWFSYI